MIFKSQNIFYLRESKNKVHVPNPLLLYIAKHCSGHIEK